MGRREELPAEVLLSRRAISVGRAGGKAGMGEGRTRGGATHAEDAKHKKETRPAAAQPNLSARELSWWHSGKFPSKTGGLSQLR